MMMRLQHKESRTFNLFFDRLELKLRTQYETLSWRLWRKSMLRLTKCFHQMLFMLLPGTWCHHFLFASIQSSVQVSPP